MSKIFNPIGIFVGIFVGGMLLTMAFVFVPPASLAIVNWDTSYFAMPDWNPIAKSLVGTFIMVGMVSSLLAAVALTWAYLEREESK